MYRRTKPHYVQFVLRSCQSFRITNPTGLIVSRGCYWMLNRSRIRLNMKRFLDNAFILLFEDSECRSEITSMEITSLKHVNGALDCLEEEIFHNCHFDIMKYSEETW